MFERERKGKVICGRGGKKGAVRAQDWESMVVSGVGAWDGMENLVAVLLLAAMCWSTLLVCQLDSSGGGLGGRRVGQTTEHSPSEFLVAQVHSSPFSISTPSPAHPDELISPHFASRNSVIKSAIKPSMQFFQNSQSTSNMTKVAMALIISSEHAVFGSCRELLMCRAASLLW